MIDLFDPLLVVLLVLIVIGLLVIRFAAKILDVVSRYTSWKSEQTNTPKLTSKPEKVTGRAMYPTSEGDVEVFIVEKVGDNATIIWNEFDVDMGVVTGRKATVAMDRLIKIRSY